MADDRTTALFFELFSGLPRQGPGDAASTLRALALVPGVGPRTRVLDVGCGTGLHTRVLAQGSPARIVAVDNHAPFVEELNRHAQALGLADRLEARPARSTSSGRRARSTSWASRRACGRGAPCSRPGGTWP
jgi:SAM-dependent methyltransferase